MKLQRGDKLDPEEQEWRGSVEYLARRRRDSNLSEAYTSACHPTLVPRVYGFLASFGRNPPCPSVLISQRVTDLLTLHPEAEDADGEVVEGVDNSDLYVHSRTGELLIYDRRFITSRDDPEERRPENRLDRFIGTVEDGYGLDNVAVDESGRRYISDIGNMQVLTADLVPVPGLLERLDIGPLPLQPNLEQTVRFSYRLMQTYLSQRLTALLERRT